jgi:hypothetical protein
MLIWLRSFYISVKTDMSFHYGSDPWHRCRATGQARLFWNYAATIRPVVKPRYIPFPISLGLGRRLVTPLKHNLYVPSIPAANLQELDVEHKHEQQ